VRKYIIAGRELPPAGQEPAATVNTVSPHYFAAFGTRLVAGRAFDGRDTAGSPRVFIISENTAKGLFGNESPIGHRLAQTGSGTPQWGEIVGVAAEVKSVVADPGPVTYQLYQAAAQEPRPYLQIAVRAVGIPPSTLVPGIRQLMTDLDPDLPVRSLEPGGATIERANDQISIIRDMLTAFSVLGLGLASLGIYGVIARTMAQRAAEFAIRFALGASIQDITRIVLTAGIRLAVIGSAVGLLGAIGISQFLRGLFLGMRMSSPPVLVATTLVLAVVALVACWLPARRAACINPVDALRAE
jgi:putative ABC transport system permease protein